MLVRFLLPKTSPFLSVADAVNNAAIHSLDSLVQGGLAFLQRQLTLGKGRLPLKHGPFACLPLGETRLALLHSELTLPLQQLLLPLQRLPFARQRQRH